MDLPVESTMDISNQKITLNFNGDDSQTLTVLVEQKTVTLKSNKKKFRKYWDDIASFYLVSKGGLKVLVIKSQDGKEEFVGIISQESYDKLKQKLGQELNFL
ncbi:hypothetical protein N475_10745 [Pseudoalteromonas luteoviolacea DSM 6061]|uniref:Uncharacterized protein n=2 Tax=Pseudoalteromonas luteoviolacea TaxID=43657 RepID=A0A166Y018_9GAMM|nr:hypothetical protein N475_10745 [Pseudoalteromonas luteoviolacea DSM 6061]MBE0389456.1 hypothetical protein [Pseudoalteromonas luteoviolacea DSM 6061]MBE0389485.1 hypothetical protein [Pseudoalteromonas luteoviolacea DSM 6061]